MHTKKHLLCLAALMSLGIGGIGCQKSSNGSEAPAAAKKMLYHCPMHPKYISDKPGDCPICGMRLVPMDAEMPSSSPSGTPGQAPVQMSEDRVQMIGVKTSVVEKRDLVKTIRSSARVTYDPAL